MRRWPPWRRKNISKPFCILCQNKHTSYVRKQDKRQTRRPKVLQIACLICLLHTRQGLFFSLRRLTICDITSGNRSGLPNFLGTPGPDLELVFLPLCSQHYSEARPSPRMLSPLSFQRIKQKGLLRDFVRPFPLPAKVAVFSIFSRYPAQVGLLKNETQTARSCPEKNKNSLRLG